MKYINLYENFSISKSIEQIKKFKALEEFEIIKNLNEILLELNDYGYKTNVYNPIADKKAPDITMERINVSIYGILDAYDETILETIERIKHYMKSCDWFSMGDNYDQVKNGYSCYSIIFINYEWPPK